MSTDAGSEARATITSFGLEGAGGQGDVDVDCIGVNHAGQRPRPLDAGARKHLLGGGVGGNVGEGMLLQGGEQGLLGLDDHERQILAGQLLGHRPAGPAVGADPGVLVESTDASIPASPPEHPGRLPGHHQLGHRGQGHEQGQDPGQDE